MTFYNKSPSWEPRMTPEGARTVRATPNAAKYSLPENSGGENVKKRQRSVDMVSYKFGSTPKRFFKGYFLPILQKIIILKLKTWFKKLIFFHFWSAQLICIFLESFV